MPGEEEKKRRAGERTQRSTAHQMSQAHQSASPGLAPDAHPWPSHTRPGGAAAALAPSPPQATTHQPNPARKNMKWNSWIRLGLAVRCKVRFSRVHNHLAARSRGGTPRLVMPVEGMAWHYRVKTGREVQPLSKFLVKGLTAMLLRAAQTTHFSWRAGALLKGPPYCVLRLFPSPQFLQRIGLERNRRSVSHTFP